MNYGTGFPQFVTCIRKELGLTQRELAEVLDIVDTSVISNWENGVHEPRPANIVKLAKIDNENRRRKALGQTWGFRQMKNFAAPRKPAYCNWVDQVRVNLRGGR